MTLLSLSCSRGPAFIAVALPDGRRRLIRRAATDLEQPLGPLVVEPRLCAYMLLPLARLVRGMLAASAQEACHAQPTSSAPP